MPTPIPLTASSFKLCSVTTPTRRSSTFRNRVEAANSTGDAGPAEVLVGLLARSGRWRQAFEASAEFLPGESRVTGFAPSLLELATRAGCHDRLIEISRDRQDALGFTAGLAARLGAT